MNTQKLSEATKKMLAFGLWHDYAEEFANVTGQQPRYAPVSGDYYSGRMWAEYSERIDVCPTGP